METKDVVFYSSENGDDWLLVGGVGKESVVRHRPNASSGGQSRDFDQREFLSREHNTPQGQALRRLVEA